MNKLVKLFITSISAITLALVSFTSSFAKVEGELHCVRFCDISYR